MRMVIPKLVCVVAVLGLWQVSAVPQPPETKPREAKPLVAVIYAEWCPMCQQLKPVLALMTERYDGKVRFVRLDMTSEKTAAEAERKADNAGLKSFFKANKEKTSLVIIQDASGHERASRANAGKYPASYPYAFFPERRSPNNRAKF